MYIGSCVSAVDNDHIDEGDCSHCKQLLVVKRNQNENEHDRIDKRFLSFSADNFRLDSILRTQFTDFTC